MTKKVLSLIVLICALGLFQLQASIVPIETAQNVAQNFMTDHQMGNDNTANTLISDQYTIMENGAVVFYAFNFSDGGFVIVSAENSFDPIIGYNTTGSYIPENQSDNYKSFLQSYTDAILNQRNADAVATKAISEKWDALLNDSDRSTRDVVVQPLAPSYWNQDSPYNYFCPEAEGGPGGKVYAGCVATTMSQIMYYWRWPETGVSTNTYYLYPYGVLTADFGATTYDFDGMVNSCDNFVCEPVALLNYHCGIAVDMGYGIDGSGAFSPDVPNAIQDHFRYSDQSVYNDREYFTEEQWIDLLIEQLDAKQPLYYSGRSNDGGHAFVCDGYDSDNKFHFNFGWSGSGDGFYTLSNVGGFPQDQACVSNFVPGEGYPNYAEGSKEITYMIGTLEDGSGPKEVTKANTTASWLINPQTENDSVASISFGLYRFDLGAGDKLSIFDGADENAPLLAEYTGSDLPSLISSTGNQMYILFETDATDDGDGWFGYFEAKQPTYCSGLTFYTEPTGTFDDGSGDVFYYKNGTNCMWRIEPENAINTVLSFNYFETEEGKDKLKIYDGATNVVLAEYSGQYTEGNLPADVVSPSGKFFLTYTSNSSINMQGWELEYTVGNVSVEENTALGSLEIWPNPATDKLSIRFNAKQAGSYEVKIFSVNGELVYQELMNDFSGNYQNNLDISKLPAGIYMLKVNGNNQQLNQKVVVQ